MLPTPPRLPLRSASHFLPPAFGLVLGLATALAPRAAAAPVSFNRDIQPILSENCYHCHGPDAEHRKGGLRLDLRDSAFAAGKSGLVAIVPGKPDDSELLARILSHDPEEVMPSPKSNRTLTPAQKDLLQRWIAEGAPWAEHWAFVPPQRPAIPPIENPQSRIENPIDAFVRARLATEKLSPSPSATPRELIRRVSLDLTGLPPTPFEVDAFERASIENPKSAFEALVDRLLASPRYGERWAWDWLDLARYADTDGFQGDPERTMWPWRDWVVNALNANLPFDQFTVEQLAGDLLPGATREQKIASGFHRNNMFNGEGGRIAEETRVENVFDRVETTATVWLGLTFTCNRCHDHKFDPLTHQDYFGLYDIFNQLSENGSASFGGGRGGQVAPILDLSTDAERAAVKTAQAAIDALGKEIEAFELTKFPRPEGKPVTDSPEAIKLPGNLFATHARPAPARRDLNGLLEALPYFRDTEPDPAYAALLQKQIDLIRVRNAATSSITKVMIMDQLAKPRDTFVLSKGNYEAKTDLKVLGAVPAIFRPKGAASASEPTTEPARLNRLDLARWLVSPANPLAARVTVNRAWQAFFGTGLVKTAEDFGVQGERPSHPELLDWLATEFVARGWDMKALHRLIVTSATYRQSSRTTPAAHERDPDNRLLARGPRYRLPSWMLRDQALTAAGLLVDQRGGPSVRPYQPPGIWEEATFGKKTYLQDHGDALYRRSLYVFWRRIVGPTTFFDAGARQVCTVKVARTNTPLHALVTLNDPAYVEAARVLAQRVLVDAPGDTARLTAAVRLTLARAPSAAETKILTTRLAALRKQFAADPAAARDLSAVGEYARSAALDPVEHAAWTSLCLLVLNLDETLSKE